MQEQNSVQEHDGDSNSVQEQDGDSGVAEDEEVIVKSIEKTLLVDSTKRFCWVSEKSIEFGIYFLNLESIFVKFRWNTTMIFMRG